MPMPLWRGFCAGALAASFLLVPTTVEARSRQDIDVVVLNGSGIPNAAAQKTAELRKSGYEVVATGNANNLQGAATVACRREADAKALAYDTGGAAVVEFLQPTFTGRTDCVVTVGQWKIVNDETNGFSVSVPPAWLDSAAYRQPYPRVLFSMVNEAPPPAPDQSVFTEGFDAAALCYINAFSFPSSTRVQLDVREYARAYNTQDVRSTFGPDSGTTATANYGLPECPDEQLQQVIIFRDRGRSFVANLTFGAKTSPQDRADAYELLNSFAFARPNELDRPPIKRVVEPVPTTTLKVPRGAHPVQEVALTVINASDVVDAELVLANDLRTLGYLIAGTDEASIQAGTTVLCRDDYKKDAKFLAKLLRRTIDDVSIGPFPFDYPYGDTANCLVFLGNDA